MLLRHRPWKLATLVVFGTAAIAVFGIDLIDGQVSLRRYGNLDGTDAPVRFALVVGAYLLATGTVVLGWVALVGEWNKDYRSPVRPELIDPDRIRPL